MKLSSVIREAAGLSPLARIKISIVSGASPPIHKPNTFKWIKGVYKKSESVVEVGQDWLLDLQLTVVAATSKKPEEST